MAGLAGRDRGFERGNANPGRGRYLFARRAEFDLMFAARRGVMSAGLAGPLDVPAAAGAMNHETGERPMTATETMPFPSATGDNWNAQLAELKARHPSVRDPILAAMNIMAMDPNITIDDAKARAALHGVRITAASVNAAVKMLATSQPSAAPTVPATAANAEPAPQRQARRVPQAVGNLDAEALIRQVVGKIQGQGNAEAERLREAIRRAVAVLQAAIVGL